ncbi:MAG: Unknown protein [uncultured Sulfurovum sp.]|uniref:Uncharacterized protein n=1 Tax=uncultured Sulfurovum sp. TaxID=269237 RepID=A0A6S6SIS7_9BACT|nr:MAG: Unknown protein [uncultured Sulfurovum sp.]
MTAKMMMNRIRKIIIALLIVDAVIALFAIIFFDMKIFINTQFGFISASLVMLASMKSYARMVDARVEHNIITVDDSRDVIDLAEDPYDLYGEEEDSDKTLKEVVKDERQKNKENKRSVAQTLKDTKAALSIYRLGAYAILILGFLYLNRQDLLHIGAYIIALSIPMLVVIYVLVSSKKELYKT